MSVFRENPDSISVSREFVVEGIRISHDLCDQRLDIRKDQIIEIPGFDLMARTSLFSGPVIRLA